MTTRHRTPLALPIILAFLAGKPLVAHAAEGEDLAYFEALPIVLTAARLPQPLRETPGSITVLDNELIRASGYRSIPRLLRLVPGMQVGQERGSNHWVTYHGLGVDYPNQMQVLIDGRSVYSPDGYSGADWSALPVAVEDIERIEVVRGSNSAAYGSNAFLGVVNILTRHPRAETTNSASIRAGPDGLFDLTARYARSSGPLAVSLSAERERDSGASGIDDDLEVDRANLRADLRVGARDELMLRTGLSDGRRGQGHAGTIFNVDGLRDARHDNRFVQAEWRHAASAAEELSLSYTANREHYREAWFGEGILPSSGQFLRVPANNDRDVRRDEYRLQHYFPIGNQLRALWGAEWRRDRMEAPFLFHDRGARTQYERRLHGSLEWHLSPEWVFNAGAMAERITGHDGMLAPRLALNWLAAPQHTFRSSYSRAYRYPSIFERHADVQIRNPVDGALLQRRHRPNPNIDPQRIDALELGYLWQFPKGRGLLDVRLFHEQVEDLIRRRETTPDAVRSIDRIVIEQALGTSQWENQAESVRLTGVEYQLRYEPWRDAQVILNHSLIRARSRDRQSAQTVAPYIASLSGLQRLGKWQAMVSVLRMARVEFGASYLPGVHEQVPAYTAIDASIAYETRFGGRPVSLRLSGINLNGRHQEIINRPLQQSSGGKSPNEIGTQVHLGLTIAL